MDAPDLDAERYARVLRDLSRVNVVTLAARPTLAFLRGRAARLGSLERPFRLLDVGFGAGDMLRAVARWAERAGIAAALTGIDLNAHSAAVAAAATPQDLPIRYRTGDYRDLAGEGWDIVVSSLVLHHMDTGERQDFLAFMEAEAAVGWFVNDLHRHAFAYHGYPLLARLLHVDPIVRMDGQLSIARAFRPAEWHAMLAQAGIAGEARVRRVFPFRLCVERAR